MEEDMIQLRLGQQSMASEISGIKRTQQTWTVRQSGTISCTVAPTVQILDLGLSPSTAYGSATVLLTATTGTIDGAYGGFGGTATFTNGHYFGVAFSAGTCSTAPTFDIALDLE